jgi:hypothetical protein
VGSRQQELAIFIRNLEFQAQFYTMSGRWIHRSDTGPKFFVPNFVEAHELDDIRPYLPQEDVPSELEDRLHFFEKVLPRNIGQPLTQKMSDFWARADAAYQKAPSRFDNAHRIMAHANRYSYATLEEIAEKVLSSFIPKTDNGKFSQDVLYALHRSLLRDDFGFRIQPAGTMRAGGEFEISSMNEVNSVNVVTEWVRNYQELQMRDPEALERNQLAMFAKRARWYIDASRESREFTTYGVIGPYSGKPKDDSPFRYGHPQGPFVHLDYVFIKFLESWACLNSFPNSSSLNGIGSIILRAIGGYEDMPLNKKTAWTALQELGAIPPWEDRTHYDLKLPSTGRRLWTAICSDRLSELKGVDNDEFRGFRTDALKHLRKDWGDLPVYCVDDVSAHELDDGISVEQTEDPEVFWVHIHTADPAAHIDPAGHASLHAELMTETVYTPGRTVSMLPTDFVQKYLSLASGRPCLTFSARMNFSGEILESNISAGIIRNVVYMTHEVLKEATTSVTPPKKTIYVVGTEISEKAPSRDMLETHQLSDATRKDLEILEKIKVGRWKFLGDRGGVFGSPQKPVVSVSFGGAPWRIPPKKHSMQYYGDPTIRIAVAEATSREDYAPQLDLVACFMLTASEVAAKWCHARGIPVPYRVTPLNPEKNPAEYFLKVFQPARDESGLPPLEIQMEYMRLISAIHPSTTPGPHVALGMDMMVRCTSPLRRFGDILTQWQIEAALLEEDRLGQSLVGNTREDFLPFSKSRIDALLPRLALRERLFVKGKQNSERAWTLQFLVRAWHFKQAEIPSPLNVSIRSVNPDSRLCGGVLEELMLGVQMTIPEDMPASEIKINDRFEVEITDIDIWARKVICDCIRRIES